MSEAKDPKEMDGALLGLLAMTAGGPMAVGQMGEWLHTFCEDCCLKEPLDPESTDNRFCSYSRLHFQEKDAALFPPWPGCRGFKHRAGTPGPAKRYRQATQKQWEEAKRKAAEVDDA